MRIPILLLAFSTWLNAASPFPLRLSEDRHHLVDAAGTPFLIIGDTPWFLQKLTLPQVRDFLADRRRLGYNTLFLQLLDDEHIPSVDGNGQHAFATDTDLTRPNDAYWDHAVGVIAECEKEGFFVILNSLWFGSGGGHWARHVKPETAAAYGRFLGSRFARFTNVLWMHVGDMNPGKELISSARAIAQAIRAAAPHSLHTAHMANGFSSADELNDEPWLEVNLAYTYGPAHEHVLPQFQRTKPARPVIFSETGYEGESNYNQNLPDGREGGVWTAYQIRRNAWWGMLGGACGFCNGTRLWRWEKDWRENWLHAPSTLETPHLSTALKTLAWWKLRPDVEGRLLTKGRSSPDQADHAAVAYAEDGTCAAIYLPTPREITLDGQCLRPAATARWFHPQSGRFQAEPAPLQTTLSPPQTDKPSDWLLLIEAR